MATDTTGPVEVCAGTKLIVDVLRWDEQWEFDCPVCVIRPVVRFSPNGESAEHMVEDLAIDASIDGVVRDEGTERGLVDRVYPLHTLRRRWNQARRGRVFGRKAYVATRWEVHFFPDPDAPNELTFAYRELPPGEEARDG
jgi:hypothetical protein